ncbi:MAG: hypothetical protein WC761_03490 [Candidatus Paceibacterota bacterium]|jgi:hypothetical protein
MKRNLSVILSTVFLLLFILYAGFETQKYFRGPSLSVTEPVDLATVRDPIISVKGKVARVAYITVNGKQIFADTNGDFSDQLLLPPGYSIIRVAVRDRFGKEISRDLHLTYIPQATTTKPSVEDLETSTTTATSTEE